MNKRLAITVSGAVSLGSYEAGVLYEVVHAIGQHNSRVSAKDQIVIDVLTGASAGAMTATIAAQKLLFEADALRAPYDNAFFNPWVKDISMENLLTPRPGDGAGNSLVSSGAVVEISRRYLTARYSSLTRPAVSRHPASAPSIRLGLAMSNLNGIAYGLPMRPRGTFVYTRHVDQLIDRLAAGDPADDTEARWERLRNAAVSSGAFPFAFQVVDVARQPSEFLTPKPETPIRPDKPFAYTDGGVFQNQPLGIAKDLVDLNDGHLNSDSRFYLFVSPHAMTSSADASFRAAGADFRETALRLAGSVLDQAGFHDWVMAEKVNGQVDAYNRHADALFRALRDGTISGSHIVSLAAALESAPRSTQGADAPSAHTRILGQFSREHGIIREKHGAEAANGYVRTLAAIESALSLANHDEMQIMGITVRQSELASYELSAFAGFFDERYRKHDYDVGRTKAQRFLLEPGGLGTLQFDPEPIDPIDRTLDGLTLDRMDADVRKSVCKRITQRSPVILRQAGVRIFLIGWLVRWAITFFLVRPQVRKLLRL